MARRFRRWPSVAMTLLAIVLLAAVLRAWLHLPDGHDRDVVSSTAGGRIVLENGPCQIVAALDGQTLLVQQGQHRFRLRLLGVAGPSRTQDDRIAQEELARIAPPGPASIELDKRRAAADGSWLAYVYVGEFFVNAELLAAGHAVYEFYPGDSSTLSRQLKDAQNDARRNRRGIWQAAE